MKTIACDTETFLISPGVKAPQLVCLTSSDGEGNDMIYHHSDPELEDYLVYCYEECRTTWMNGPFDHAVLLSRFPRLAPHIFNGFDNGRIHDVMLREMLIDLGMGTFRFEEDEDGNIKVKGYSLAAISKRRKLGSKQYDQWRLRYHELWDVPIEEWPDEAIFYAVGDAKLTRDVHMDQEGGINLHDEMVQVAAHWALHLASCYGIKTDAEALKRLRVRVVSGIEVLRGDLISAGLVRPDATRDTKAAIRLMLNVMGEEALFTKSGLNLMREDLDKDGRRRTRGDVLALAKKSGKYISVSAEACDLSGSKILRNYSMYTRLRNLLTGSIKHLERGTILPIQTRFSPLMETGRTSSSGPNIQNLRKAPGVRECFVPRKGNVFVAADYRMAELHTLAQTCLELFKQGELSIKSHLADALNEGRDVHLWFASKMLQIDYDDALVKLKAKDVTIKNARQLAKAANFGFPGGCSARRFVAIASGYKDADGNSIELTDNEAYQLRAMWFASWPEMQQYFDYISDSTDDEDWYWVKQPITGRFRAKTTYTSACNSYFQGLAADGAKLALYEITRRQFCDKDSALYGTAIVNFVHDEIIVEAPEDRCDAVARELEEVMAEEFNSLVPDVPTQAEAVVMRFWSKEAERIEHEGKLVPWPLTA